MGGKQVPSGQDVEWGCFFGTSAGSCVGSNATACFGPNATNPFNRALPNSGQNLGEYKGFLMNGSSLYLMYSFYSNILLFRCVV